VGWIVSLVTLFKGLKHLDLHLTTAWQSLGAATVIGVVVAFIGKLMINRVKVDDSADRNFHFASVERVFTPMMIFTACAMAFAHGSNDVANGIGPMAAVVSIVQSGGEVAQKAALPLWILALGGVGIVIGLATMGYRVMQTIGTRITELTPTRGYCATLAAAVHRGAGLEDRAAGVDHADRRGLRHGGGPSPRHRRAGPARHRQHLPVLGRDAPRRGPARGGALLPVQRDLRPPGRRRQPRSARALSPAPGGVRFVSSTRRETG
jgi:hypothetical protein